MRLAAATLLERYCWNAQTRSVSDGFGGGALRGRSPCTREAACGRPPIKELRVERAPSLASFRVANQLWLSSFELQSNRQETFLCVNQEEAWLTE